MDESKSGSQQSNVGEDMKCDEFSPFYERVFRRWLSQMTAACLVALALGLGFLALHYESVGNRTFEDWSWVLAVVICSAALSVYYATDVARKLCHEIGARAGPEMGRTYIVTVSSILSDKSLVQWGVFFALLNCVFGILFGLPYREGFARGTILVGYFVAGFVCGLAALGIYAVFASIERFAQDANGSLDFAAPDGCGGTAYLGDALVVFGSVTLVVGVGISIYIFKTNWLYSNDWWRELLQYFWIAFPYVLSLTALLAPAIPMHTALERYKTAQESAMRRKTAEVRSQIEDKASDATKQRELRELLLFHQNLHVQLYKMRTWPYDLDAKMKYGAVVCANLLGSISTVSKWMEHGSSTFL